MILNKDQLEVINYNKKKIFLLAGAGTGKTRTIIERIKILISDEIASESQILALSFTKKSALEMKMRIGNDHIEVSTFHSICLKGIKEYLSDDKKILEEDNINFGKDLLLEISNYKNKQIKNKPYGYDEYQEYLETNNILDFDDLQILFLELLDNHKILNEYHNKYKFIFVDEFQDTNNIQYEILKKLITKETYILCVGDPDQSIYRFRGANHKIIDEYIKDCDASVLTLSENYRSGEEILNLANKVISLNKKRIPKNLYTSNRETEEIKILSFVSYEVETKIIIKQIKELLIKKVPYEEIAILYRNHERASHILRILDDSYIPYRLKGMNDKGINLMTIHQAKGLEFTAVFIIGLEKNLFPSDSENRISELYEERRLLFVGITRAKRYLIFTAVNNRNIKPSCFFSHLNKRIISKKYLSK